MTVKIRAQRQEEELVNACTPIVQYIVAVE
jgi:hypothetical protein